MADASGQADIRGLDVDKVAKAYADEEIVLKKYVNVTKTSAREIRWYKKTTGFLDSVDTTGITTSKIYNVPERALPTVVEQSWTRQTSYVKKYFVESPTLSDEDIRDSDIDILMTNIRDLVRAVANQVDIRIYAILNDTMGTGGNVNTAAAVGTGWDDTTNGDAVKDLLIAKKNIRNNSYNPEGAIVYMHPTEEQLLLTHLITTKGSSIPSYSSKLMDSPGAVMEILGLKVVISANATTDNAVVFVPQRACTWKSFIPLTTATIKDAGIGTKIRIWEEGEAILTDPKAVHVITDTTT